MASRGARIDARAGLRQRRDRGSRLAVRGALLGNAAGESQPDASDQR